MQKDKIRKCIENYQLSLVETLEKEYHNRKDSSNKDDHDVNDADAHSHQLEAHEEAELLNERLTSAKKSLDYFKSISQNDSNKIGLGSLIETNKFFIYIGITTQKFSEEGRDIIGISTNAPIYQNLQSKTVGDTFKYGPDDCTILSIQ